MYQKIGQVYQRSINYFLFGANLCISAQFDMNQPIYADPGHQLPKMPMLYYVIKISSELKYDDDDDDHDGLMYTEGELAKSEQH